MIGRIVYTVTLSGTPAMPPATGTLNVGAIQTIDLVWHYSKLDPRYKDTRAMSKSDSGLTEVRRFNTQKSYLIEVRKVPDGAYFDVLDALNDEIAKGALLTWYPDYGTWPDEYFYCVGVQRIDPERINMHAWSFSFELLALPTAQAASTVPDFVL